MAIIDPMLPAKKGYVEVEVNGLRMYRDVETGELLTDGPMAAEPTEQDDMAALLVDHEYRMTLLELGLTGEGGDI